MDLANIGHAISVWLLPVILAITFHEAAHGWMAERCGDRTARVMGRVTFNPLRHVDPVGTLILPGMLLLIGAPFLFGYAKPVPVDFRALRNPKRDMIWVALAGPGINIILAFTAAILMHVAVLLPNELAAWVGENLVNAIIINIVLAVFNMLPLLPLDGGRVLTGLLPTRYAYPYAKTEPYGLFILLGLLFVVPMLAQSFGSDFNPIVSILWPPISAIYEFVIRITGLA